MREDRYRAEMVAAGGCVVIELELVRMWDLIIDGETRRRFVAFGPAGRTVPPVAEVRIIPPDADVYVNVATHPDVDGEQRFSPPGPMFYTNN